MNGSVSNTVLYEMEKLIQKIHAQVREIGKYLEPFVHRCSHDSKVGNAETEGYNIVVGIGATMVIYSAVSSIAEGILDVSWVCCNCVSHL